MKHQKLDLTWIGKENRPKLEPRILLEDPEKSYHAKHRVTENDIFHNRLIFGDNLFHEKRGGFPYHVERFVGKPPVFHYLLPTNTLVQ